MPRSVQRIARVGRAASRPLYRERLGVPAWWWPVTAACVFMLGSLLLGTTLLLGLSLLVGGLIYAVLLAASAALLLWWGASVIEVTRTELRAGAERLPVDRIGKSAPMDPAQTRELRGPRADPAAYLLTRPYLAESVYVEVTEPAGGRPYWLIGTRRPADLMAAIEAARNVCDNGRGDDARKEPDARQAR
jgi:hypothetical protein